MATNLYGGVKDAATGKPAPAGVPAAEPNGKPYSAKADSEKRREIREATNEAAPVYGCMTREEWLPGWLGEEVCKALIDLGLVLSSAPQPAPVRTFPRNVSSHERYTPAYAEALAASIADTTPDKIADKTPAVSLTNTRDIPADKTPAILPQDVQDNSAALEAIALKDAKTDTKVALNNAVMAELGKVVEGTNRCLKVAECFLQARGLEVYLCHRQNAAGIVVGTSLTEGDPVRPVFRMADLERFLMSIGDKAETPEPAPVAAKPYTPPPARPPRKGYPAWLVREYAGIGPLETL